MNQKILLVDNDEALRRTLSDRLRREGYVVDLAADGEEGFQKATHRPFDLIILDIMLPKRGGFDVCRDLRNTGVATPILLLSASGATADKVVGLKLGGDDYVTKPFEAEELMARIEALLRRASTREKSVYQIGSIRIDVLGMRVTRDGKPIHLAGREFQLLRYFVGHSGVVLSRDEILRDVWGYGAKKRKSTRTVDVHVAELRQKLERDPKEPELILTVTKFGYKFEGRRGKVTYARASS